MELNKKRLIMIVAGVAVLIIIAISFTQVNFKKLVGLNKNIVESIMEGSHDIFMGKEVDVEYIKSSTGSTKKIEVSELPQEFQPIQKYTHPPFIMGACQVCHAPKRSKPAAIITKKVDELCYICHIPQEKPKKFINCNKCHNPHQAKKEHFIRDKIGSDVKDCPVGEFVY